MADAAAAAVAAAGCTGNLTVVVAVSKTGQRRHMPAEEGQSLGEQSRVMVLHDAAADGGGGGGGCPGNSGHCS